MGTPFFNQFKKQASFFLREKIKHARLALTDVTPAELLTEEATSGNPWAPYAKTMGFISRAAFDIDEFWRIVEILHKRMCRFEKKNWREFYNGLVLLEHLLTHGPESVAEEFLCDREVIQKLESFQLIDEKGFNWGLAMRKKSERLVNLLENGPLLKQERDRARKVTRGIQGFGSMNYRGSDHLSDYYDRCNSHYESYNNEHGEIVEGMNKTFSCDTGPFDLEKKTIAGEKSMKTNIADAVNERLREKEGSLGDDEKSTEEDLEHCLLVNEVDRDMVEIHLQKEDHPFVFNEHQRMESMILLSQS